jgi:hypothetical protein
MSPKHREQNDEFSVRLRNKSVPLNKIPAVLADRQNSLYQNLSLDWDYSHLIDSMLQMFFYYLLLTVVPIGLLLHSMFD